MAGFTPRADLVRLDGWERRLADLANGWKHRPYAFGVSDCGCFMRCAVAEVTGVVLLEGIDWPRGWLGVAKFMIANGWNTVEETMNDLLPAMPVTNVRRGDIVSFTDNEEFHLAVSYGDTALTPGVGGLVAIDGSRWRRGWRVG